MANYFLDKTIPPKVLKTYPWANQYILFEYKEVKIKVETEKAYLIEYLCSSGYEENWFPKSTCKIDGNNIYIKR